MLLAVIVGFQKRLLLTFSLLALSLLGAWFIERLSSLAFLYVSLGLILAYYTPSLAKRWQTVAQCTLLAWCGLLLLHIIPGFENPKVLDGVLAGPNCSGQLKLATVLEFSQYKRSDSLGVNPPLY